MNPVRGIVRWASAVLLALLAVAVVTIAAQALASEDATAFSATSTSGASASMQTKPGTVVVLQSQACAFHYRACSSSSCTAVQTDLYVKQYDAWPVQLTSDRSYIAVACDGTTTGVVYQYALVVP